MKEGRKEGRKEGKEGSKERMEGRTKEEETKIKKERKKNKERRMEGKEGRNTEWNEGSKKAERRKTKKVTIVLMLLKLPPNGFDSSTGIPC